MEGIENQEIGD